MPNTTRGYTYPDSSGSDRIWEHFQELATDIDTDVGTLVAKYMTGFVTPATADGTSYTTAETLFMSITCALITGVVYAVEADIAISTTLANDIDFPRVREDTITGNTLQAKNLIMTTVAGSGYPISLYAEYTAVATANKTFVVTGNRIVGTGAHQMRAAATSPNWLRVTPLLR
jgi:hypothetical protein